MCGGIERGMSSNKKHLLIFAHCYEYTSAAQLIRDLAEGLLDTFNVTVICVVPSYFGTVEDKYKTQKYYFENVNGVEIIRVRVPEFSKTNKMSRVQNILVYFFRAMWATGKVKNKDGSKKVDYVLSVSQPPILGGLLGVWGKWRKRAKYIYQIQDFNPEQVLAVNYSKSKLITGIMMWLDKFSCWQADLVITVGRELVETLENRFQRNPDKMPKVALINNWIDESEIYPLEPDNSHVVAFKKKYGLDDKFVIMYSGNIGLYYDLENLMKVIQRFKPETITADGRKVVFTFVGTGAVLNKLIQYKEENRLDNVVFIPYQDKAELNYSLNAGDVHWCVNAKGIKGVSCPSKYYGLAAAGKPVLGVLESGTEICELIKCTRGGLVCEPEDYTGVEKNIQWFIENAGSGAVKAMGQSGREYLLEKLTKDKSIRKYAEEMMKL